MNRELKELWEQVERIQKFIGIMGYTDWKSSPLAKYEGEVVVVGDPETGTTFTGKLSYLGMDESLVFEDLITNTDGNKYYTRYIELTIEHTRHFVKKATKTERMSWVLDISQLADQYQGGMTGLIVTPSDEEMQAYSQMFATDFMAMNEPLVPELGVKYIKREDIKKTDVSDIKPKLDYNPKLVNTDIAPKDMVKKIKTALKKPDCPTITLLFHGEPGTSKTYTAKYIAQELGMEVESYVMGDILKKYVGESEQAIKKIFEEANAKGHIIHIDEIEGLVSDREDADKSWQVSQTNAFLQGLDEFRGIFIGTTNFTNRMDRAFLRRFLLTMQFNNLDSDQAHAAWRHFFKGTKRKEQLEDDRYAVSDYNAVKRSLIFVEDGEVTSEYLTKELKKASDLRALRETRVKRREAKRTPIGFNVSKP